MRHQDSFQRWAALAAIASAVMAAGSIAVALPAMSYDFGAAVNPLSFWQKGGPDMARVLRWSLLLDLFGYYLFIAPLVMVLDCWLRPRAGEWSRLCTGCLLAYLLLGAVGAAVLAAVGPHLHALHGAATPEQRPAIEAIYLAFTLAVHGGIWNLLEVLLAGVGWFGVGWLLRRERPAVGILTMVLGVAAALDSIGTMLGAEGLSAAGLSATIALAPLWALVMGITLLRKPVALPG